MPDVKVTQPDGEITINRPPAAPVTYEVAGGVVSVPKGEKLDNFLLLVPGAELVQDAAAPTPDAGKNQAATPPKG